MFDSIFHFYGAHEKLILDITTSILGLLYIFYNYHQRLAMWTVGAVMQILGIVLYYKSGLYADCGMEFYYLGMTIYGFAMWKRGKRTSAGQKALRITHLRGRRLWGALGVMLLLWVSIGTVLYIYTDSKVPVADSFTTALSIVGIWMLARKYIEQWWVWWAVDVVTCGLYYYKGIPFKASLYGLYVVIAVLGYKKWKGLMKAEEAEAKRKMNG